MSQKGLARVKGRRKTKAWRPLVPIRAPYMTTKVVIEAKHKVGRKQRELQRQLKEQD